jgi:hypothetical protein
VRILDRLTGGGVDWQIELGSASGAFRAGDEVTATIRYVAKGRVKPRAIRAALVCTEEYVYEVLERSRGTASRPSSSSWQKRRFHNELFRQDMELSGPTELAANAPGEFALRFALPADALPSFEGGVLRLVWQLRAWMDLGGRDPSTERDIYVLAGAERLAVAADALAPAVQDAEAQASIYLEPAPLAAGQPFRGYLETTEAIDVRSVRVELRQRVETTGASGGGATITLNNISLAGGQRNVADERVLWQGQLAPMEGSGAGHRYQFGGQLPLAPTGTLALPHGTSVATIDVVISRRLLPDRHVRRPVGIVTG